MPGKHNAGGCGCCGEISECWNCAIPLGINVAWPTPSTSLAPCGNCEFFQGDFLRADAIYDNLDDPGTPPSGQNACAAVWADTSTCFVSTGSVTWDIMHYRVRYQLDLSLVSGFPRADVRVNISEEQYFIEEDTLGSGVGDPTLIAWDYNSLTMPEVIDGWSRDLYQGGSLSQLTIYRRTFASCPSIDYDLPVVGSGVITVCPSDLLTVTLYM